MILLAGSYERYIWGIDLRTLKHSQEEEPIYLKELFKFPSHNGHIRSVAISGSVAASGGIDDTIKIYSVSSRASSEIGSLQDHSSTVNALQFVTPPPFTFPRNLIAAYDDGSVCIYDANPFVHLKTINAHKKAVNDLSIHPSGKLCLTVGRDGCLGMLNLVRGRRSFYCRLAKEASIVKFDSDGEKFFMVMGEKVSMHEAEDAKLVFEMDHQKRVLCAAPASNGLLFTGGEDRGIKAWDTTTGKVAYSIEDAHSSRVKGIVVVSAKDAADGDVSPYMVASASSDGVIRVWDVRTIGKDKPKPLAEHVTRSRITCLAGSSLKSLTKPKVGKKQNAGGEDDE